jgi:hypothetical protein
MRPFFLQFHCGRKSFAFFRSASNLSTNALNSSQRLFIDGIPHYSNMTYRTKRARLNTHVVRVHVYVVVQVSTGEVVETKVGVVIGVVVETVSDVSWGKVLS